MVPWPFHWWLLTHIPELWDSKAGSAVTYNSHFWKFRILSVRKSSENGKTQSHRQTNQAHARPVMSFAMLNKQFAHTHLETQGLENRMAELLPKEACWHVHTQQWQQRLTNLPWWCAAVYKISFALSWKPKGKKRWGAHLTCLGKVVVRATRTVPFPMKSMPSVISNMLLSWKGREVPYSLSMERTLTSSVRQPWTHIPLASL